MTSFCSFAAAAALIFLVAESSADDALALGCFNVDVGEELTERELDLLGLLAVDDDDRGGGAAEAAAVAVVVDVGTPPKSSSSCTMPCVRMSLLLDLRR
jgi:hypothetical protein